MFLALALAVIFASVIGAIVLGVAGVDQELRPGTGRLIGSFGGVLIGWLGLQLTAVPDTSHADRLQVIVDRLREEPLRRSAKSLKEAREHSS